MIRALAAVILIFQVFPPAQASADTEIELRRSFAGHVVLSTMIGDRGPYPFILDTGANQTAILETLARQIGLSLSEGTPDTFYGLTGPSATIILGVSRIDFGAGPAPVDEAVTIDANIDSDLVAFGILGTDAFAGRQVEIDFNSNTLWLDTGHDWAAGEFPGWLDGMGLLRTTGTINSVPVIFIVDTGATRSFVNGALAESIMTRRQMRRVEVFGMGPQSGMAGEIQVGTVRFAGFCQRNVRVLATDFPIFETLGVGDTPAMIVGLDLLGQSNLRIDFSEGRFDVASSAACRRRSSSLFERNLIHDNWGR